MNFGKTKLLHFSLNEGSQIISGGSSTQFETIGGSSSTQFETYDSTDDLIGKLSMVDLDE